MPIRSLVLMPIGIVSKFPNRVAKRQCVNGEQDGI